MVARILASASTFETLGAASAGRSAFPLLATASVASSAASITARATPRTHAPRPAAARGQLPIAKPSSRTTSVASAATSCPSRRGRHLGCTLRGHMPLAASCRLRSPRRAPPRSQAPRPIAEHGAGDSSSPPPCEHLCREGLRRVKAGPSAKHTRAHTDSKFMRMLLFACRALMLHMRYEGLVGGRECGCGFGQMLSNTALERWHDKNARKTGSGEHRASDAVRFLNAATPHHACAASQVVVSRPSRRRRTSAALHTEVPIFVDERREFCALESR